MKVGITWPLVWFCIAVVTCTEAAFIRSSQKAASNISRAGTFQAVPVVHQALAAPVVPTHDVINSSTHVKEKDLSKSDASASQANLVASNKGGTACQCICGDRTVWRRAIFEGDVVKEKEKECEYEICPSVNIPGLNVVAKCEYTEDIRELTGGTICSCTCGGKQVWRQRRFYGEVVEEKEEYCLKTVCPKVAQLPGMISETQCKYDPKLFETGGAAGPAPTIVAAAVTLMTLLSIF